ncbi:MAG: serine/threonine protein kinase [Bradymonadia bacterium]|jgi:serine/threonine protein kinase
MAEIFRARRFGAAGFQKELVIKKILPHLADNDDFVRMFIDEAKLAVTLQHNNIVQIFDLGAVGREYFIAMEYVAGKDLLNLLIRCTHLRIRVPQKLCIHISMEILRALEAAHTAVDARGDLLNIIHRDVSPSNVLINYGGTVKLGDFGVAKALAREQEQTHSGTMKGKLGYMSPEQITAKSVDQRSDLFGVGIILYEMLAMNRLFKGDTDLETMVMVRDCETDDAIDELASDVSGGLRRILRRALARESENRYQTAAEFHEALADLLFEAKQRIASGDMRHFMRSVFAKEIEEEATRRDAIEKMVGDVPDPDSDEPATHFPPVPVSNALEYTRDSVFRVRRQAGQVTEPMGLTAVMQLLDSGALDSGDLVSIDDGPFRSSRTLAAVLHGEAPDGSRDKTPLFSGRFSLHDFPRLLYRYAATRATGRMLIACDGRQKEIYWRTGRPEYVTSTARDELLGEYLVERGLITRPQLNEGLARISDFQGRLGDALLNANHISAGDLFEALGDHVKAKLIELFSWTKGVYAFFPDEQTTIQILPLELNAYTVINEAIGTQVPIEQIQRYVDARAHMPVRTHLHRRLVKELLGLTPIQARLWPLVQGNQTLNDLVQALLTYPSVPEDEVLRLLYLMERLEFIAFG